MRILYLVGLFSIFVFVVTDSLVSLSEFFPNPGKTPEQLTQIQTFLEVRAIASLLFGAFLIWFSNRGRPHE